MADLMIMTENIEPEATHLVYELAANPCFARSKIRIMPDVNMGTGCVVGFTATMTNGIIPNVIGVDIGCGMRVVKLGKINIDFAALDTFIKENIPAGFRVGEFDRRAEGLIEKLACRTDLRKMDRLLCSLGTLGGGNHFIEVDRDSEGAYYLVIHTGSRNLGLQIAKHYQRMAVRTCKDAGKEEKQAAIARLKAEGRVADIPEALSAISKRYAHKTKVPDTFCYLTGEDMQHYLHDVEVATEFATLNRTVIADRICAYLGVRQVAFETLHNYIGKDGIVRKGAISALEGEQVIIPMNMRDGCLLCHGKGNPEWNYSAPHGAGRLLSRSEAKYLLTVEEFQREMTGIYTTTANSSTLDESPMAYKPMQEIIKLIAPTVVIDEIIKPVYNFKAADLQEE
ncbi:MAG: RtcB family protein [Clostridia bacterium]|nr:RtcB family protein [Clostridia bacterium]